MEWLTLGGIVGLTLAIFAAIGGATAWSLGLRGLWGMAAAPALAISITSASAVVAPWMGLGWSLLPVAIVTVALCLLFRGARFLLDRRSPLALASHTADASHTGLWSALAVVIAGVLVTFRYVQIIGSPQSFSQTFDNIFHLNAVRFMVETANASSLNIGHMTDPLSSGGFYPSAWHGLVALLVQITGAPITLAVNAFVLAVSAVVWPLGAVLLTRTLFASRTTARRTLLVTSGLVAGSLPTFPLLLIDYGVLYPYQLGVALVPVALALTVRAFSLSERRGASSCVMSFVALATVLVGIALAHPSALVSWLALSAPVVLVFVVTMWVQLSNRWGARIALGAGLLAYLALGLTFIRVVRPPIEARGWPLEATVGGAIMQVLTVSTGYQISSVIIAILVVLGIVMAVRYWSTSSALALGFYAIAAILFVTVTSLPLLGLRDLLTGPWYNNVPRLAALLPLAMVPLAAWGVARTVEWASARARVAALVDRIPPFLRVVAVVGAAALAVFGMQVGPMQRAVDWAAPVFAVSPDAPVVSTDELALFDRLDETVPEGVVIAGSAWTGSSLAFAFANRPTLQPHTLMGENPLVDLVNNGLSTAEQGSPVCRAIEELNVGFVLDFGGPEVHGGEHVYPGLEGLDQSDAVRLVDQEGDARLYEVVACGRGAS